MFEKQRLILLTWDLGRDCFQPTSLCKQEGYLLLPSNGTIHHLFPILYVSKQVDTLEMKVCLHFQLCTCTSRSLGKSYGTHFLMGFSTCRGWPVGHSRGLYWPLGLTEVSGPQCSARLLTREHPATKECGRRSGNTKKRCCRNATASWHFSGWSSGTRHTEQLRTAVLNEALLRKRASFSSGCFNCQTSLHTLSLGVA